MPTLNRTHGPRGPRFYTDDGRLTFINVMDGSTRDGPRHATREDTEDHPEAWAHYVAELQAAELDEQARQARVKAVQDGKSTDEAERLASDARKAKDALKGFNPFRALVEIVTEPEEDPEPSLYAITREDARIRAEAEGRKVEGAA